MPLPRYKVDEFALLVKTGFYRAAIQKLLGRGPGVRDGMTIIECIACLPPPALASLLEWARKENGTLLVSEVSGGSGPEGQEATFTSGKEAASGD